MNLQAFYPIIVTPHLSECRDFYRRWFGFEIVFEATWFVLLGAGPGLGTHLAFMHPDHPSAPPGPEAFNGKGMCLEFQVPDAGAEHDRFVREGAAIGLSLRDEPFGQRRFGLFDPAGVWIDVVEQIDSAPGWWDPYRVAEPGDLATHLGRLLECQPGTAPAETEEHAIQHLLMRALKAGGRAAGEEMVHSLLAHGHELERLDALPCMWRVRIAPPRVLELWFLGADHPVIAATSYRVGAPWGTEEQKRAARMQAAFYERYETLSRASGTPAAALSPDDHLIELLAEFEADVNNGGFAQYLGNKGVARARAALASLRAIGARRTARLLSSALRAPADAGTARLDSRFHEDPEDLATLAMTHIEERRGGRQ